VKLLTGNDLGSGDVIWWTGSGWSRKIEDAADIGDTGESVQASEENARRVNASYIIEATSAPGGPRPAHIKDRVRALGPTVRMDLGMKPGDLLAAGQIA
jgi:Protein of unknown function (DUF2849)